jgi:hypothetical protein
MAGEYESGLIETGTRWVQNASQMPTVDQPTCSITRRFSWSYITVEYLQKAQQPCNLRLLARQTAIKQSSCLKEVAYILRLRTHIHITVKSVLTPVTAYKHQKHDILLWDKMIDYQQSDRSLNEPVVLSSILVCIWSQKTVINMFADRKEKNNTSY